MVQWWQVRVICIQTLEIWLLLVSGMFIAYLGVSARRSVKEKYIDDATGQFNDVSFAHEGAVE